MPDSFDPADLRGLSSEEVLERLSSEGYNELPQGKKRGLFHIVFEVFREPMFLLLVACGLLYLILGDPEEALMLLGFVAVIIGITVYQEGKTEKALDALRDLSSPRALVVRDGEQRRIAGKEVVRDDIVLLAEGDRVPADALVLHQVNLSADESLLTGESVPVRKAAWDGKADPGRPGGDDQPMVYSGSMVVRGQAVVRVTSTGIQTEMGKIGKALQTIETGQTRLQAETGRIVKSFALAGLFLCVLVVLVFGFTRGNWLRGVLAGLSLAMATLPEEFPVVLTVFLALGAWRISKRSVLTRRMPAVETLGSATVLCTDKTGTLTMNRMTVAELCVGTRVSKVGQADNLLPEEYHALVEHTLLASPKDPFDPMEKAMRELGVRTLMNTEHLRDDWKLLREYPLSEKLLAMSRVWESTVDGGFVVAAKGAPEAVSDLCHLDAAAASEVRACVDRMAADGLRVIAVASSRIPA
ncbi:MAG TPA: HAD-IC family P-type ATPase, partial [Spirochaetia bacterium]|nr:HAD-IC family P-type ATPase [Spirochaetia bacterium]